MYLINSKNYVSNESKTQSTAMVCVSTDHSQNLAFIVLPRKHGMTELFRVML
jgi:hypothetical protein